VIRQGRGEEAPLPGDAQGVVEPIPPLRPQEPRGDPDHQLGQGLEVLRSPGPARILPLRPPFPVVAGHQPRQEGPDALLLPPSLAPSPSPVQERPVEGEPAVQGGAGGVGADQGGVAEPLPVPVPDLHGGGRGDPLQLSHPLPILDPTVVVGPPQDPESPGLVKGLGRGPQRVDPPPPRSRLEEGFFRPFSATSPVVPSVVRPSPRGAPLSSTTIRLGRTGRGRTQDVRIGRGKKRGRRGGKAMGRAGGPASDRSKAVSRRGGRIPSRRAVLPFGYYGAIRGNGKGQKGDSLRFPHGAVG